MTFRQVATAFARSLRSKYLNVYNKIKYFDNRVFLVGHDTFINVSPALEKNPNIKGTEINLIGHNISLSIGRETSIKNSKIYINGNFSSVTINNFCNIENSCIMLQDHSCSLLINSSTVIRGGYIEVSEPNSSIKIGEGCFFEEKVNIRTGDSHSILDVLTNQKINHARNIVIEDRVWIGQGAWVLKGINVGCCSIVVAGSFVTRNLPRNSLSSGIPACVERQNISWGD